MAADENDYVEMKDFRNYSLKDHNTFGIDAKCSRYLEFEDDFEAMDVAEILRKSNLMASWCAQASKVTNSRRITSVV